MAVVDVTQMWSRDSGVMSAKDDDRRYRGLTRTTAFQVLVDDPDTSLIDVQNATGIPEIGDLYPGSSLARVISITPTRVSPIFWQVDVNYQGDNDFELNRPIITKSSVTSSEPIDVDWNGRAIVNVNNEIVEGLSRDVSDTVITIQRNFVSVNDDLALSYLESVNSDNFGDGVKVGYYAPGRVRMTAYNAVEKYKTDTSSASYWQVTAQFQARFGYYCTPAQAWNVRYRNEGLLVKDSEGFLVRPPDENGQPQTKPVLLKTNGQLETNPNNAIFLFATVYGSRPFNALGLL